MNRVCIFSLLVLWPFGAACACGQQPGASTEIPSRPYLIKQTWIVGGNGSWDYLTMDPRAKLLYIAHGHSVQAVDVTTGAVAGEISGLAEAHAVALDDTGEFGYISDGLGGKVIVFDRRTLAAVATIDNVPSPRALVFEPQTRLLFAVRSDVVPTPPQPVAPRSTTHIPRKPAPPPPPPPQRPNPISGITVIDTQTRRIAGQILVPGTLGYAITDERGSLFVADRDEVIEFNAQMVAVKLPGTPDGNAAAAGTTPDPASESVEAPVDGSEAGGAAKPRNRHIIFDWTGMEKPYRLISLVGKCAAPKSLAIDSAHTRLFAACDDRKLLVLNADNGDLVARLPIGPGVDSIAYDAGRNLIYAANGGADGSLTVIGQSVTDSYAVLQTLPTRQRARTLALDSESGQIYLVTDMLGVNLAQAGAGPIQTLPVNGSFEVLVVGN